jgi:hypothetical protein
MNPIHARLTKLSTLPGATIDPEGARGQGPIEEGYYVLGYYIEEPVVGQPFRMVRYESNGVKAFGIMTTSPVVEIKDSSFKTANSIYQLIKLLD